MTTTAERAVMKHHLHDDQFDGHLHAACGRTDAVRPGTSRASFFVEDLGVVPYEDRCRWCARIWWPRGGEPVQARRIRAMTTSAERAVIEAARKVLVTAEWLEKSLPNGRVMAADNNELRAALAALDAEVAPEDGWRPIETAPKDGTPVDLWCQSGISAGDNRVPDCWYSSGKWWRYDERGDDDCKIEVHNAVYWRPLPSPPAREDDPRAEITQLHFGF